MSNTLVVDQQRSALPRTRRWQTAARHCPRDLVRLRWEPVSDGRAYSVQAEPEAFCLNRSLMLDLRRLPPVPRYVPDLRAEGSRISLLSDAQHRALPGESLAQM